MSATRLFWSSANLTGKQTAAETGEKPATKSDLVAFAATLTKAIENQPVSVQLPPQPQPSALESSEQKKRPWWKIFKS